MVLAHVVENITPEEGDCIREVADALGVAARNGRVGGMANQRVAVK